MIENVSRRKFIQASGGLVLAVALPAAAQELRLHRAYTMGAFVRVGTDSTVTVIVKHLEMGQGTYTGLPALVAEELDADWSQMRAEGAPADAGRYNNLFWGAAQGTGGSTALANSWEQLRKAGAAARAMLVAAAAEKWNVPAAELTVVRGKVIHAKSKRQSAFGPLAAEAAKQPVPADLPLKDPKQYNNLFWGEAQGTGGSTALANSWEQLRKAGAAARAMLVAAAADKWGVPASEIRVSKGIVFHKTKKANFGALAADAAKQSVPTDLTLKDPKQFKIIGKTDLTRTDARAKSNGTAQFTQDVKLPGMLTAVVLHPPRFGAIPAGVDAAKARQIAGVVDVVVFTTPARSGVAVLAKDYWTAKKGRDALLVEWDESNSFKLNSSDIFNEYRKLSLTPGLKARRDGDPDAALAGAARTLEATYEFPFLAHASMEPMNCVVELRPQACEVWNGEQFQTVDQAALAQLLGLKPEQVRLNMLYAGGGFGRRANPKSDFVLEAAAIAKAIDGRAPVKLVWGREDDLRAGFYRPAYVHALKAGLDAKGDIVAWKHTIVGQSILTGTAFESVMVKDGIDGTSVEGAANLPYAIPNLGVDLHTTQLGVPVQWWRSVGSTHTAYATECFLDDLARAAGKDPFELRRTLLANHPRHKAVLELAARQAGWNRKLPKNRARGIAVHESFNTIVAQVVEVSKRKNTLKIDRVTCAVDCGIAVTPQIVAMQMESGIGYGLSAALFGAITLKDGVVEQSNFHDYPVLRMNQMPRIDVHILPSREKPSGVGEPATPVIAPALANALAALEGKPLRSLPLSALGISFG